jgi:hypothetical protein
MFCVPRFFFDGTEGVRSRFHLLSARTRFRRYRGCRLPFPYFALPDSFPAVPRASGPVFVFCTPNSFSAIPRLPIPFSYFALSDTFSAVPRSSDPVFMFCVPILIFGGTKGAGSHFHVLRSRTRFRRYPGCPIPFSCFTLRTHFRLYRRRRVPFSCFVRLDSCSALPRSSDPIFMFCVFGLIFGGTECVGSRFKVLRVWTLFRRYRGVRFRFHILRSRTHFRRY